MAKPIDTLSITEAAAQLGFGEQTIRNWLKGKGRTIPKLKGVKDGAGRWRIPVSEVNRLNTFLDDTEYVGLSSGDVINKLGRPLFDALLEASEAQIANIRLFLGLPIEGEGEAGE